MTSKRTELSLTKKVELIKNSSGKSHRQLAEIYGIGRTQVGTILKRKAELMEAYDRNEPSDRKRFKSNSQYEDIDTLTWQWFQCARSQQTPITGPLIQEKAIQFAKQLNRPDFKAS